MCNSLIWSLEPFPLILLASQGQLAEVGDFDWAIMPNVVCFHLDLLVDILHSVQMMHFLDIVAL